MTYEDAFNINLEVKKYIELLTDSQPKESFYESRYYDMLCMSVAYIYTYNITEFDTDETTPEANLLKILVPLYKSGELRDVMQLLNAILDVGEK